MEKEKGYAEIYQITERDCPKITEMLLKPFFRGLAKQQAQHTLPDIHIWFARALKYAKPFAVSQSASPSSGLSEFIQINLVWLHNSFNFRESRFRI